MSLEPRVLAKVAAQVAERQPKTLFFDWFSNFCSCLRTAPVTTTHFDDRKEVISLLPQQRQEDRHKRTLVLDLDETLVHSEFSYKPGSKFTMNIYYQGYYFPVYVFVRPGTREFLKTCSKMYEIIVFTASLEEYASPLIDLLDIDKVVSHRLYRDDCTETPSGYVKDLRKINRNLQDVLLVDVVFI